MSSEECLISTQTAQVVTERLVAIVSHPDKHVAIDVVLREKNGAESPYPTLWLAPTNADVITLADDSEIIQCVTHEGFRASVFVGEPEMRPHNHAKIILGTREDSDA